MVSKSGHIVLYGITAGHALQDLGQPEQDLVLAHLCHGGCSVPAQENEGIGIESSVVVKGEHREHEDESEDEDSDLDADLDPGLFQSSDSAQQGSDAWSLPVTHRKFEAPTVIGSVLKPLLVRSKDVPAEYYDWALFETSEYAGNKIAFMNKASIRLSTRGPGNMGVRPVAIMSGTGSKKGRLLPEPGRILVGPGEAFVETHMLTVDDPASKPLKL
jgi:hypothetical protein